MIFFYSNTCIHCSQAEPIIDELEEKYGNEIIINRRVIQDSGNKELYFEYLKKYNISFEKGGVPTFVVNDEILIGTTTNLKLTLQLMIEKCINKSCETIFDNGLAQKANAQKFMYENIINSETNSSIKDSFDITLPLIISSALLDSINPCAFAVLVFLITSLLLLGGKTKMLKIGFIYILSVYLTYLLAGIGLLSVIQNIGINKEVFWIGAITAIIVGLINIKDYFFQKKNATLSIPLSAKPLISKLSKKGTIVSAIILGVLVSMFELPCTGGVYLAILGLLSNNLNSVLNIIYLLIYNFIFVLPLIIILILINYGANAKKLDNFRKKNRYIIRLYCGIIMVFIGLIMLFFN